MATGYLEPAPIVRMTMAGADEYAAVMLTGSGTLAVEAMLSSFAPVDSKTLVVANGVYGERIAAMLAAMGRPAEIISAAWDASIDVGFVEEYLRTASGISHIAAVHHETTTGRLNDVAKLGAVCAKYDCGLLLDAISSFGAEEIGFRDWNLKAVAGTANKCLHGAPGLSFVLARKDLYTRPDDAHRSVYMNLHRYYQLQHDDGYSPFTQAVQVAFALDEALDELHEQGGWTKRRLRYRDIGHAVQTALSNLSVETFIPEEEYSSVMCSYRLPANVTYQALRSSLKSQGFIIYAGQGQFSDSMFRIAHMGAIHDSDVERPNESLTSFFRGAG